MCLSRGNQNDLSSRDERSILPRCHPHSAMPHSWPTGRALAPGGATPADRCCPVSLALCAGAYWRALEARGLVRWLTGPFAPVAAPASTNRWVSVPATGRYSSRSSPVFRCGAELRGRGDRCQTGPTWRGRLGDRGPWPGRPTARPAGPDRRACWARETRRSAPFAPFANPGSRRPSRSLPEAPIRRPGPTADRHSRSFGGVRTVVGGRAAGAPPVVLAPCYPHLHLANSHRLQRATGAQGAAAVAYQYSSVWRVPMSWPLSRTKPRSSAQPMTVSIMAGLPHRKTSKFSGVRARPVSSSMAFEAMTFCR